LYSIGEKEIYRVVNQTYATYAANDRHVTYGGGHNIYVCNKPNESNSSYSNWSSSYYETKGKTNAEVTGSYNFTVQELEVFEVIYDGEIACLKI